MLPGLNAPVTLATRTGNGVWVDNGPWTGYSRAVREHPNIVEIPKRIKQSLFFTGRLPIVGCSTLVPSSYLESHIKVPKHYAVGLMLWFMRKEFDGSYLFFKATRRS
jgi:hypothetical protein